MTNHTDHDHEATPAARAACRKAAAKTSLARVTILSELLAVFATKAQSFDDPTKWVFSAAHRFASYTGSDPVEAAAAVYDYFAPSGDEAKDARRRANGYTVTTSFQEMLSITLRAAS